MPDEEKTLAIAKRTRKNLDFIYSVKGDGADVEEFTHLLNSMLCMVICLREEYFKGKEVSWDDLIKKGLTPVYIAETAPSADLPKLKSHSSFSQLISSIRHEFAHNCFKLSGDSANKITGITIWNVLPHKKDIGINRSWQAEITEQQLKDLAYLFIDYICYEFGPITQT